MNNIITIDGNDSLLASYYNSANVLVYTSVYEGFGLPILEAMASGCPVIAMNTSSIPEVSGNAGILLSDPYNIDMLANSIKSIINGPNLRESLVAKGLHEAKRFSWNKCAKETLEVYKNCLNK